MQKLPIGFSLLLLTGAHANDPQMFRVPNFGAEATPEQVVDTSDKGKSKDAKGCWNFFLPVHCLASADSFFVEERGVTGATSLEANLGTASLNASIMTQYFWHMQINVNGRLQQRLTNDSSAALGKRLLLKQLLLNGSSLNMKATVPLLYLGSASQKYNGRTALLAYATAGMDASALQSPDEAFVNDHIAFLDIGADLKGVIGDAGRGMMTLSIRPSLFYASRGLYKRLDLEEEYAGKPFKRAGRPVIFVTGQVYASEKVSLIGNIGRSLEDDDSISDLLKGTLLLSYAIK